MATGTYVPVEVYLRSSDYEPDAEYIDGEIVERPRGAYDHGDWQGAVYTWLLNHSRPWNVRVIGELKVQVAQFNVRSRTEPFWTALCPSSRSSPSHPSRFLKS